MMQKLFEQALHIKNPWLIEGIEFDAEGNKLDIFINFKRGSTFLEPESNEECKPHDTVRKTWRHLNFFQYECYLHARVPRVKRSDGKVKQIQPPWNGKESGFTLLFEAFLLRLIKSMPVNQICAITGIHNNKLWHMLDSYVDTAVKEQNLQSIDTIGIDETSVARGHDYVSLFVDLNERRTIHISEGKSNETVIDFVEALESRGTEAKQIKSVSCDMSPAFIKGVTENLPNALITFDKFHILKIINEGVDSVRRAEAKNNPLLKGKRFIFLKNDNNLTKNQRNQKEALKLSKLNLKSVRAMSIREAFQQLYTLESVEEFEIGLKKWYFWATHSRLEPMIKAAKTIKNHWDGVLRWIESKINNGILEGLNSILQAAKRKARGYKARHFRTIAYLLTGKLDFSSQNKYVLPT